MVFQAQSNQTQPQPGVHQNQVPPQQSQREKSPAPQQGQKSQSNVRQIPIFVEGRDKPVIARERDEPDFSTRRQQSPPHFQRPSHFQQQYNRQPSGWGSNFQVSFFIYLFFYLIQIHENTKNKIRYFMYNLSQVIMPQLYFL